jgi:hypothetical protein
MGDHQQFTRLEYVPTIQTSAALETKARSEQHMSLAAAKEPCSASCFSDGLSDPETRVAMLEMARVWVRLADHVETDENTRMDPTHAIARGTGLQPCGYRPGIFPVYNQEK